MILRLTDASQSDVGQLTLRCRFFVRRSFRTNSQTAQSTSVHITPYVPVPHSVTILPISTLVPAFSNYRSSLRFGSGASTEVWPPARFIAAAGPMISMDLRNSTVRSTVSPQCHRYCSVRGRSRGHVPIPESTSGRFSQDKFPLLAA